MSVRGAAEASLEQFGKERWSMRNVTLAGFGVVLLFLALAWGVSRVPASPSELSSHPLIEVRLVLAASAEQGFPVEFERENLKLAHEPIISDPDFVTVRASSGEDASGRHVVYLSVDCTTEADARMRSISGQHMDGRMAILVDGEVRAAPVIRGAVGCSMITMGIQASESEAEQLAERVQARWPERP
jgi:preprotein translocase subunit SecD